MAAEANKAKNNYIFSYFIHQTTVDAHKSTRLSAGTHSLHALLYFTAVYASADTASSSGANTHAELLRLPSTSRRRDGARVVVVVGASAVVVVGACVVVVVGAFVVVVVVVVVVGAFVVVVVVVALDVCTLTDSSFSLDGVDSSFHNPWSPTIPFPSPAPGLVWTCDSEDDELKLGRLTSPVAAAHTDGQQHRASTNRAHSRRHVIIVSVVVQWCGADLHSEGHGEQQGRREVRQTHTEGTPHEERAAARHAPYAAHHARHTLQSTAAGTHTHTALPQHQHTDGRGRSKQERHTRLHRMHIRREPSVVSAALTEGTHTHKRRCSAHSNTKAK
ncbi:hypothetical protein ECC02_004319 [Trypanosoma cruzi]|uniref:Uncharacterized protein n=1 Tax=Trypanosoma cruzi TaxID=5693 RepID=A0A7J6Y6V8_TRYCR|nr:hypothetical protein ECC02_004319 [Trypanosoma cruzi]